MFDEFKRNLPAGVQTRRQQVPITDALSLTIRSLADHQQYADPDGHAEKLGISSAVWPLFGLLWPSSVQLARKFKQRPVNRQEHILELGCGLGLSSLIGHQRGARVTASDCHPLASMFLRKNQALNGMSDLPYRHAQWGANPDTDVLQQMGVQMLDEQFDLIIGSDLLYERDTPASLTALIQRCARPQAEVWLVDPDRGHRSAFTREMSQLGFQLTRQVCLKDRPLLGPDGVHIPYKGRFLAYQRHAAVTNRSA